MFQFGGYGGGFGYPERDHFLNQIGRMIEGGIVGGLVGAALSDRLKQVRKVLYIILAVLFLGVLLEAPFNAIAYVIGFFIAAVIVFRVLRNKVIAKKDRPTTFGSAQWADLAHLQENGLIEPVELRRAS